MIFFRRFSSRFVAGFHTTTIILALGTIIAEMTHTTEATAFSPIGFSKISYPLAKKGISRDSAALISHQSVYDMHLASVRSAAGIVGAEGTMQYKFTNGCDGWTIETQTSLTMLQTQGGLIQTSWNFLSWESKDGKSYRFRLRSLRNGKSVEAYNGNAHLSEGGRGSAVFHLPDTGDRVFDLPEGTLFPTAHTLTLIQNARRGMRFLSVPIFDGSDIHGAFQVSAALGDERKNVPQDPMPTSPNALEMPPIDTQASDTRTLIDSTLLRGSTWPVTLAFFDLDTPSMTPSFEVHLTYHANGIADSLRQDFQNFSLRGRLIKLENTPNPDC